jgi:glycosyltransferase involved in cell wall biosynthesis
MVTRNKGLQILHCIPGLHGGGAERQLSYLCDALQAKGIDVHVAYHLHEPTLKEGGSSSATIHKLPSYGNHDPRLLWELVKVVRRIKPDVIQTWLLQMDVLGGLAAVVTGTPLLMTERSIAAAYGGFWKGGLRNWIGRRAALVVANSRGGREYWVSRKRFRPTEVVPNAVPVAKIQQEFAAYPETCDAGTGEGTEILLFAGRYSAEKNLFKLLDALGIVLSRRPKAIALLYGGGPLKGALVKRVKLHRMEDRIKILDYTEHLWRWMKRASVFVSVSLFEGSPNVVAEAAAAGCPLVLSDIQPHRELFGDNAARFVSFDQPTEIASGILDVLQNPEGAKAKAHAAYEIVSGFTVDSLADRYLNLYNLVAKRQLTSSGLARIPIVTSRKT